MPGTIQQELIRILTKMRTKGVKRVWLSRPNIEALSVVPGYFFNDRQAPIASTPANPTTVAANPVFKPSVQQAPVIRPPVQQTSVFQAMPQKSIPEAKQPESSIACSLNEEASKQRRQEIENADIDTLARLCNTCTACSLCNNGGKRIFSAGAKMPRVLFIGDIPTADDTTAGKAFSGAAGQMLYKMGLAMGLSWDEDASRDCAAAYSCIVKCRPATSPTENQISTCKSFIMRQIALAKPEMLILLGAIPTKQFIANASFSKLKNAWTVYNDMPVLVINSPVTIMRYANQNELFVAEKRQIWSALQEAMIKLGLKKA